MSLRSIDYKTSYNRGWDDIASEFYLPSMRGSIQYDRAVGFFSSSVLLLAWDALEKFVGRGGRIRIVCSHHMSDADIRALSSGYSCDEIVENALHEQIEQLLQDEKTRNPLKLLACLVRSHVMDLKVAVVDEYTGVQAGAMFHSKLGLFRDDQSNVVAFKGSMNETWNGLANDGNLETVDVFISWGTTREETRVRQEIEYFESLWTDRMPGVRVYTFPSAVREKILRVAGTSDWHVLLQEVRQQKREESSESSLVTHAILRKHQVYALDVWRRSDRRGILAYATGSGKTYVAMCAIRDALEQGEVAIVVVPSIDLLDQWKDQLRRGLEDLRPLILICGGGNVRWQATDLLRVATRERTLSGARIILATLQTASSDEFLSRVTQGEHILLVVDEVHRSGSPEASHLLSLRCGPRLGLSATPTRYGDEDGSARVLSFFDGVLPCVFTLSDGIREGVLTPYFYYPIVVHLSEQEREEWLALTTRIGRQLAAMKSKDDQAGLAESIKLLAVKRARIAKTAEAKLPAAVSIVKEYHQSDQRWLIYCDSAEQASAVASLLRGEGLPAQEYHTKMIGHRKQTLRRFDLHGGILVAIRCLDEGVDVPLATHGLIIASSTNPREFIQRRGRLLRRAQGKLFAHIHDVLIAPPRDDAEEDRFHSLVQAELARAFRFGSEAENPDCVTRLKILANQYNMTLDLGERVGYEYEQSRR